MDQIETFDHPVTVNPLYKRQREDVAKMRTSLLSCTDDSVMPTRQAIQRITVLRVYHQITRIIRYLEIMDKLEDKMYAAIDYEIENSEISDSDTWVKLMAIQEKLQKSMIESHKMLQPYLDITEFSVVDLTQDSGDEKQEILMSPEKRDNLRMVAQSVLEEIMAGGDSSGE